MIQSVFIPGHRNPITGHVEDSPYAEHALLQTPARYCADGETVPEAYIRRSDIAKTLERARDWEIALSDDKRMWGRRRG